LRLTDLPQTASVWPHCSPSGDCALRERRP
jgi:hypothetical protein